MFQIDLAASGNLCLILPGRRSVEIPSTPGGLVYIQKILKDHANGLRDQRGYIGTLPTQHAVNKHFADQFLKNKREAAAKAAADQTKVKAEKLNIDFDKLSFTL
jgi:hypothetical protein